MSVTGPAKACLASKLLRVLARLHTAGQPALVQRPAKVEAVRGKCVHSALVPEQSDLAASNLLQEHSACLLLLSLAGSERRDCVPC